MVKGTLEARTSSARRGCKASVAEDKSRILDGKKKPVSLQGSKDTDERIFTKLKNIFQGPSPGDEEDAYTDRSLNYTLHDPFYSFPNKLYDGSNTMQASTTLPSFEMGAGSGNSSIDAMGNMTYGDSLISFDQLAHALAADSVSFTDKEKSAANPETPLTHLALMDTAVVNDVLTPIGSAAVDGGCEFADRLGKLLERCMSDDGLARDELVTLCATEFNLTDSVLSPAVVTALLRFCLLKGQLYLAGQLLQIAWERGVKLPVGEQCEVILALCSDEAIGLVRSLLTKLPLPSTNSDEVMSLFVKGVINSIQDTKHDHLSSFVSILDDSNPNALDIRHASYLIEKFFDEVLEHGSSINNFENIALNLCRLEAFSKVNTECKVRTCAMLCLFPPDKTLEETIRLILSAENVQIAFLDHVSKYSPLDFVAVTTRLVSAHALGGLAFLCSLYLVNRICPTGASVLKICLAAQQSLTSVIPEKLRHPGFGDFEFLSCVGVNSLVKCLGPGLPMSLLSICASVSGAGKDMFSSLVDSCLLVEDHNAAEAVVKYMNEYYGHVPPALLSTTLTSHLIHGNFKRVLDYISKNNASGSSKERAHHSIYAPIAEFGLRVAISVCQFSVAGEFLQYCHADEKISSELSTLLQQLPSMIDTRNQVDEFVTLCESLNLDESTFAAILDCCLRLKNTKRLLRLVNRFRKMGLQPQLQTCGVIIKSLGCCGRIAECKEIWHELTVQRGHDPNEVTYGIMLDALVNNNQMEEAMKLFEGMKQKGNVKPNTIMYTTLIKGFSQNRQLGKAMSIYKEMVNEGVTRNTVTYNSIIDACARVGDMKSAAALLEEMMENKVEPDLITFSTIIKGYCVQSNMDQSFQLLSIMYQRGIKPDGILYNSLLEGCVKSGRLWLCEKLWEQMQLHGIAPSNFTLTILIKMYGRSGQLDKVFDLVARLPVEYGFSINAHVYTCLMSACIANGRYSTAIDVYKCMKDGGIKPDARTYETLLLAASKGNMFAEAADILRDIYNASGSGKGGSDSQGDNSMLRKIPSRIVENLFSKVQTAKVDAAVLSAYRVLSKRLQSLGMNIHFSS
ncbi:ATPase expression protein 3 [Babesia gibsoni]|uniref:ATPase expression protein 3 n=1 Tax=Babesia gibsoni TaxID=33632 RepID=A0AAD8LGQ1_BABGI|nr:ATPase expression protein 3 [Babesia gibsoni]